MDKKLQIFIDTLPALGNLSFNSLVATNLLEKDMDANHGRYKDIADS